MFKLFFVSAFITIALATNIYAGQSSDYVGISAGLLLPSASILTDKNGDSASLAYDNMGASVSASIGHQFGIGLRVEEELSYKRGATNKFTYFGTGNSISTTVTAIGAMSNLYYDWYHSVDAIADRAFSPYFGAGIGFANVSMSEGTINDAKVWNSGSATVFAYQVALGSGIKLTDKIVLDVSYRYFDAKDIKIDQIQTNFANHNILIGARYSFR
jgi:OOP family OmpA-OmpF porin